MANSLGGPTIGPDLAALARALLDVLPCARATPVGARKKSLIGLAG